MAQKNEIVYENGPVPLDESWWAAVLEDVEAQYGPKILPPQNPPSVEGKVPRGESSQNLDNSGGSKNQVTSKEIDWAWVKRLYEQDLVIDLEVADHNRGGLLVGGDSIQGFVPASHLIGLSKKNQNKNRDTLLSPYIGRMLRLKVIECDQDRGRIVLSERAAQTDSGKRLELLNKLKVGDHMSGKVTTITDFGVFVDLGGVEGLIHISELSWGRVCHPNEIVSVGEEIDVHILQIDRIKTRVALSLKRLNPNPWESIHARYKPGQIVNATITNVVSFGAFARLDDGLDGLIHISEFGGRDALQSIKDTLSEGQTVIVSILHIDPERQRLGLSLHKGVDGVM